MENEDFFYEVVADCLLDLRRYWFFDTVVEVFDDYRDIRSPDLEEDRIDLWAAAFILAAARCCKLEQKDTVMGITDNELSKYFEVDIRDIAGLTELIIHELKSADGNRSYRPVSLLYIIEDHEKIEEDEIWMPVEVIYTYKRKIDSMLLGEFTEIVEDLLSIVNDKRNEGDKLIVESVSEEGCELVALVCGYLNDINLFSRLLEEFDVKFLSWLELYLEENLYAPTAHYVTFMEQYELMNIRDGEFENMEGAEKAIESMKGKSFEELKIENKITPENEANIHALKLFSLHKEKSVVEVKNILKDFPDCIEAHICQAGWQVDASSRIQHLEKALQAGERILDMEFLDENNLWWGDHRTRPYMRAMQLMAVEHLQSGKSEEGVDMLWELIEMNENDNQSNRVILMDYCIYMKKWSEVRELLEKFKNSDRLIFVYGKLVYMYYTLGKKSKTRKQLMKAYRRNKYPMKILAGKEEYPDEEVRYFDRGSSVEALEVLNMMTACFERDQKFAGWCFRTLLESTDWYEDERANQERKEGKVVPFGLGGEN